MPAPAAGADRDLPLLRRLAAHRFTKAQLVAIDVVTVTLIAVTFGFLIPHRAPRPSGTAWDAGGWVTYAVAAGVTPFRRRFPPATLAPGLPPARRALDLRARGGAADPGRLGARRGWTAPRPRPRRRGPRSSRPRPPPVPTRDAAAGQRAARRRASRRRAEPGPRARRPRPPGRRRGRSRRHRRGDHRRHRPQPVPGSRPVRLPHRAGSPDQRRPPRRPRPRPGPDQLPARRAEHRSDRRRTQRAGTAPGLPRGQRSRAHRDAGTGRPVRRAAIRRAARGRVPRHGQPPHGRVPHQRYARQRRRPVTIRVVIADDQALVRGGFVVMVGAAPGMEVLGEAADGAEAVALVHQHHPDVVLMDIRMPVLDGIEATRAITTDPDTAAARVLMLTTFDLDDYVYRALRAGASGFLLKDTAPEELLAAIRTLAAGDALLDPGVTRRLIREFASRPEPGAYSSPRLLESLSAREREVLAEVAGGWSNAEIGERLHISAATAKTHVSRLLMKLDAHDRAQLVMIAYETRLVTPG